MCFGRLPGVKLRGIDALQAWQATQALLRESLRPLSGRSPHHSASVERPSRRSRYTVTLRNKLRVHCVTNALAEVEHAVGGKLRGPESLYENITRSAFATIDNSFPATKGAVRASDAKLEAVNSKLEAELEKYKNENTAVINSLVSKVNALTPVGTRLDLASCESVHVSEMPCGINIQALCRDTMGLMG